MKDIETKKEARQQYMIGNVPTAFAARVFGKSQMWVREEMLAGRLPIGTARREGKRANVYISPKLLYEFTGTLWKGEKE